MSGSDLRAPNFPEQVAIDNYKDASKAALAAATSFADKVVTASFSFATAYGAVLALVSPKDTPNAVIAVLPFILFGGAVLFALIAQGIGVETSPTSDVDELQRKVSNAIGTKRILGLIAVGCLAAGVIAAGIIVNSHYAEPAETETAKDVSVLLTPTGIRYVAAACEGEGSSVVAGSVDEGTDLSAARVDIEIAANECASTETTLSLPQRAIAVIRS